MAEMSDSRPCDTSPQLVPRYFLSTINTTMRKESEHPPIPKPDSEGYITWHTSQFPDVEVDTWYRINGSLEDARLCAKGREPLILLHGGPGATHQYLLTLLQLLDTERTIIMYE